MAILRVADTLNSAKCTDVKKTFIYRSNPANRGLSARYNERFSLLHFWTVKYMKNNLDKTKPRCTTVILSEHITLPVPWLSYVILRFHCSWLSRLKKPQLAEYLRNRCLFSRVTSWLSITVTELKFLNLNYLWMGKKKLFKYLSFPFPFRNYLGKNWKKNCSNIYLHVFPLALS